MKLRVDLIKHITLDDLLEEASATIHRYKPEPTFSKTGVGSLSPTSIEERVKEGQRSTALTAKLLKRAEADGK